MGLAQLADERFVVVVTVEDALPSIAAVDDVVANVADGGAGGAGHGPHPTFRTNQRQSKVECPLFSRRRIMRPPERKRGRVFPKLLGIEEPGGLCDRQRRFAASNR